MASTQKSVGEHPIKKRSFGHRPKKEGGLLAQFFGTLFLTFPQRIMYLDLNINFWGQLKLSHNKYPKWQDL